MIRLDSIAFLDVDTQVDFVSAKGALSVPGGEALVPTWRRLMEFARANRIPIVASADTHAPDDPEFTQWPPHCVKGTPGHAKIPETTVKPSRTIGQNDARAVYRPGEALVIEKSVYSVFDNPSADSLLKQIGRPNYVVFGLATDYCVRADVLGLLDRGYGVFLVRDAVAAIGDGEAVLAELVEAGARLVTADEVLAAT